jgi:hypothetical protein
MSVINIVSRNMGVLLDLKDPGLEKKLRVSL